MDRGDGYHNMYGAEYLHLPPNLPFLAAEDIEPRGDGLIERTGGPTVVQNATPNEQNQGQAQEGVLQPEAQNEDQIQPAYLLLPREPAGQPNNFFLLYDYETEDSEQEESDLEDSDSEEDDGENQENDMDTVLHETLSEVSLWKWQHLKCEDPGGRSKVLKTMCKKYEAVFFF